MDLAESVYDFYNGDYIGGTINAVCGIAGMLTVGLFSSAKQTTQKIVKDAMVKTVRESTKEMTKEAKKQVGKQFGAFLVGKATTKAIVNNAYIDMQKVAMEDILKQAGLGLVASGAPIPTSGIKSALAEGAKFATENGSKAAMAKLIQTVAENTGIHGTREVGKHFAADAGRAAAKKAMETTSAQAFAIEIRSSLVQGSIQAYKNSQGRKK